MSALAADLARLGYGMERKRRRGSARFAPYYKVQFWRPDALAWQDVQAQYPTIEAAQAAFPPGQRCRVMEVTMQGRRPLPETDTGA